jgi:hypothetical protein
VSQFLPAVGPILPLALAARTCITAKLLTSALDLEQLPTIGVPANSDTAGLQVFRLQNVIKNGADTEG